MALLSHLLLKPLPSPSSSKTTLVLTQPLARIPTPHSSCSGIAIFSDSPNPLQSSPNQSPDFSIPKQQQQQQQSHLGMLLFGPWLPNPCNRDYPSCARKDLRKKSSSQHWFLGIQGVQTVWMFMCILEHMLRLVSQGECAVRGWLLWALEERLQMLSSLSGVRKGLEKLRAPSVTELLLSNDGDRILEGSVTNFFVVCSRDVNEALGDLNEPRSGFPFEVQTAPVTGGVLPGVIRQLVVEVCSSLGIPLREVAPSWANRELWKEAFVTNSLRLVQHVEKVQAPSSWESLQSKTWKEVSWVEKQFEGPGPITTEIQKELTQRACAEGFPLNSFL